MERDDLLVRQRCNGSAQLLIQCVQLRPICRRVGMDFLRAFRQQCAQRFLHVSNHFHGVSGGQPDVGIVFAVVVAVIVVMPGLRTILLQQRHALGTIYDLQRRQLLLQPGQKRFHPSAVDQKRFCPGQGAHVAGEQLIIMQAACGRRGHAGKRHAVHIPQHVLRQNVYRIKGGHDLCVLRLSRAAAAKQQRQKQDACDDSFHGNPF